MARFPIYTQIEKGLRPQGAELLSGDIGTALSRGEGFGPVQPGDVGLRVWAKPYGLVMESEEQRKRRRRNPEPNIAGEVDPVGAHELDLFIVNDADLYRQQHLPIIKNLVTKMARGTYDSEKAVKLFMYLAESGAKKYVKEFGAGPPRGLKWHEMFNVATRREVAKSLRDSFETEAELGNYDHLLPKKYQR